MDQGQWDIGYWVHQCDKCEARVLNMVEIEMASAIILADVRMELQLNKTPAGRAAHCNAQTRLLVQNGIWLHKTRRAGATTRGSHIHVACRSVCDWDQESWSVTIFPDCLITLFQGS